MLSGKRSGAIDTVSPVKRDRDEAYIGNFALMGRGVIGNF